MRQSTLIALISLTISAGGYAALADVSSIIKDSQKRTIVLNPCDENPKPKHCNEKF